MKQERAMSKTTAKTAEMVEFPTFDAEKTTDQIRAIAEKGVAQTKEAYERMKTGAEEAQKAIESTLETARSVNIELSQKAIAAMRANAEATFAHLEALLNVKSVSEFVELQTTFLRKRLELGLEQAKEMQVATTKAAEQLAKPGKELFEKATRELKVA
jgi:phasin